MLYDAATFHTEYAAILDAPLMAVALHAGHAMRDEVLALCALDEATRRREEDPYTGVWSAATPTRMVARRSRFEVDLNRPRESAVYQRPEHAWGLNVWLHPPPEEVVARSLRHYDAFYARAAELVEALIARHRRVIVLDLHSYNHRRSSPRSTGDDPAGEPEINLGTGSLDRTRWASLVERFLVGMRDQHQVLGRSLDVRENVRFQGGHFVQWLHARYPRSVCGLAIEVKKFFMDEWSGVVDEGKVAAMTCALERVALTLIEELHRC